MLAALSTTGLCGQLKVVDLRLTCCVDAARTLRAVQARGCAAGPALPTLEKLSVQLIQPRKQDLAAVRLLALAAPSLLTLRLDAREADPGCGPMNVEGLTSLRSVAVSGPVAVDVGAEPMPRLVSLRFDRLPSDNTIAARINGRILTALHHLDARCLVSPFQSVDATRLLPGLSTLTGLTSLSTVLSDASAVEGLTGLERLSASAAPGGDLSGVRCLSRLSAMVSLTLSSSRTSLAARDVAGLPDTLTKLRELTLWCSLSPGALAALSKATQLTALSIDASARQQTGGAAHDADHPESVGRGWDWLSRLAGLQVLEIHSPADLGDDGGGLGELPSLRELRLRGGALRSAHVRAAGSCRRLRRLHIGPMTLEDMDPLVMLLAPGSFAKLRELELCGLRGLGRTGAGLVQRLSRGTRSVKDQVIVGWVLRKLSSAGVAVTTKGLKF
ncbi:unnamed protein product [Pedinophyceae sp. YPF-701]|nr:unnamed protein product [Pedinophyceae sp. YPF-701]